MPCMCETEGKRGKKAKRGALHDAAGSHGSGSSSADHAIFFVKMQRVRLARAPSAPPVSRTDGAGLLAGLHVVCPLALEAAGGEKVAAQNALLVLVDGHLEAVEALEGYRLARVGDANRLGLHLGVAEKHLAHAGPCYVVAIVDDE